ncbi:MAG: carboxypeptidase-like regulatory domain-containing protein [Armatimonadota bacterium]|nr:carboxypeptidase-like regulatory domain-containing protein [Armatimonadota bacterium]
MPEGAGSAFTDENGRFALKDLVPGKYRIFTVVNNLIRTNIATVEVTADKPAFVELKILPLTSLVRGQVITNEGNPIPNAEVTLVMAKGWNTVFKVQTDANGKFEIRNLPAGLYYIIAEAKGRAKVFAGKFEFEPEKVHDGIRITLPKAATIVGKVVTPKGKPVPAYATVMTTEPNADLYLPAEGGVTNAFARIGADGTYRLTNLAPGTYTLRLVVEGEVVDKVTITVKEGETATAPPLRLK